MKKRIGVSSCYFHADPTRPIFKGKTLLYLEKSMGDWIMRNGAIPLLLPEPSGQIDYTCLVDLMDGLILQGGSDVCPRSYGETALDPKWEGDAIRDQYEIQLIRAFQEADKPILGICRGLQIINVAFGGTLYQDIETQIAQSPSHRDWQIYDQLFHEIEVVEKSNLAKTLGRSGTFRVNSVHHQAIKDLAPQLEVEAKSLDGLIIEAIRHSGSNYLAAVQWHPEFQTDPQSNLLPADPLFKEFLDAC